MRTRNFTLCHALLATGLLSAPLANAADNPAPPPKPDRDAPPLELLEFLGNFETPEGKWIDPRYFSGESNLAAEALPKEKSSDE